MEFTLFISSFVVGCITGVLASVVYSRRLAVSLVQSKKKELISHGYALAMLDLNVKANVKANVKNGDTYETINPNSNIIKFESRHSAKRH